MKDDYNSKCWKWCYKSQARMGRIIHVNFKSKMTSIYEQIDRLLKILNLRMKINPNKNFYNQFVIVQLNCTYHVIKIIPLKEAIRINKLNQL
jgi:uncharacterized FlaG/YvyC family protein